MPSAPPSTGCDSPEPSPRPRRRKLLRLIQLGVVVLALYFVFSRIHPADARSVLARMNPAMLPIAVLIALAGMAFSSWRWSILLRAAGIAYPKLRAFRCYLSGAFYSLVMPGVVGGDVSRVLICRHDTGGGYAVIAGTVLLERALGVGVLMCVLAFGLAVSSSGFIPSPAKMLVYAAAACGLVAVFCLPGLVRRGARGAAGRYLHSVKSIAHLAGAFSPVRDLRAPQIAQALVLTALFQLTDVAMTLLLAHALNIALHGPALLVALPLVYLATALPISPSGLGLREATLAFILPGVGAATESDAALLALATFGIRIVVGILGGLVQLLSGAKQLRAE